MDRNKRKTFNIESIEDTRTLTKTLWLEALSNPKTKDYIPSDKPPDKAFILKVRNLFNVVGHVTSL